MRPSPQVPIFGIGGVRTGTDALEFLLAGASAVQVGTALFGDPTALPRIIGELRTALDERGFDRVRARSSGGRTARRCSVAPEGPDPLGDASLRAPGETALPGQPAC